jgi:hypothetical protein
VVPEDLTSSEISSCLGYGRGCRNRDPETFLATCDEPLLCSRKSSAGWSGAEQAELAEDGGEVELHPLVDQPVLLELVQAGEVLACRRNTGPLTLVGAAQGRLDEDGVIGMQVPTRVECTSENPANNPAQSPRTASTPFTCPASPKGRKSWQGWWKLAPRCRVYLTEA